MTKEQLMTMACEAMNKAYAPYSGFQVGAALLTKTGKVYCGCNIENAAYGPTNCAERTAFFQAIYAGEREFEAIAVVGGMRGQVQEYTAPCGVCRQVMAEFCDGAFEIHLWNGSDYKTLTLDQLLPLRFGRENLTEQ